MREGADQYIERVEHLMLSNSRRWNSELIDTLFHPNETALIKQIPLALGNAQDIIAWMFDSKGFYSVKSGYKVCWENTIAKRRLED